MKPEDSKVTFCSYMLRSKALSFYRRLFFRTKRYRPKSINHIKVQSAEDGNRALASLISSGKPFAAIRFGGTEMSAFLEGKAFLLGLCKQMEQATVDNFQRQSGFFPNQTELLPRYAELIEETSREIDYLASYATRMENYMVHCYMNKNVIIADNRSIEPYYFENPWSEALRGKKVLVIHPFADTIEKQFKKRELLFANKKILPDFELHTIKAVQTICGTKDDRFDTWFDALDFMFNEAMKIPFDIAILGCGAYGQPLACMLKKAGKQAIHIGGGTQILFGIRGKRWELNSKEIPLLFNEHWVRPSNEETPKNKSLNEFGGAYW